MGPELAAAGLIGGFGAGANIGGTLLTNKALKEEARRNRRFQAKMTAARYPLSMYGMKKAGLNPILAANPGSVGSAPSGAMASNLSNPLGGVSQSLIGAMQGLASVGNIGADTKLKNAQTIKTITDTVPQKVKNKGWKAVNDFVTDVGNSLNGPHSLGISPNQMRSKAAGLKGKNNKWFDPQWYKR